MSTHLVAISYWCMVLGKTLAMSQPHIAQKRKTSGKAMAYHRLRVTPCLRESCSAIKTIVNYGAVVVKSAQALCYVQTPQTHSPLNGNYVAVPKADSAATCGKQPTKRCLKTNHMVAATVRFCQVRACKLTATLIQSNSILEAVGE